MAGVVVVVGHLLVCFAGAWSGILGDDHKGIQNGLDVRNVTFREGILHNLQETFGNDFLGSRDIPRETRSLESPASDTVSLESPGGQSRYFGG